MSQAPVARVYRLMRLGLCEFPKRPLSGSSVSKLYAFPCPERGYLTFQLLASTALPRDVIPYPLTDEAVAIRRSFH